MSGLVPSHITDTYTYPSSMASVPQATPAIKPAHGPVPVCVWCPRGSRVGDAVHGHLLGTLEDVVIAALRVLVLVP